MFGFIQQPVQEVVSILQMNFDLTVDNLSRQEQENILFKHPLECVKPTKHSLACQSGIKIDYGHLILFVTTLPCFLKTL